MSNISQKELPLPEANLPVSIRASATGYVAAFFIVCFFSLFLAYLEFFLLAIAAGASGFTILASLTLTDRIIFDGKGIQRVGALPQALAWVIGTRKRLKLNSIEQVETITIRSIKRGGRVLYRYRTIVRGKGLGFVITSGNRGYREFVSALLPRICENMLDLRSIELRDYLSDHKETLMKAEFVRIPPADVLESSFENFRSGRRSKIQKQKIASEEKILRAEYLRILGNELRILGYLPQAIESFRRATQINPHDGRLLMEFARCLHSYAGARNNRHAGRKSVAMMRLAERRAINDSDLLGRLGESYFGAGEFRRADNVFRRAANNVGESFRSVKGLAELALREGKIAHVILHFSAADRLAVVPALRKWSRSEADYFARLHDDEEYMDLELSRVNLLGTMESGQKICLRTGFLGILAILAGIFINDGFITNIGWAVSIVSILIWVAFVAGCKLMSQRIPFELLETYDR